MTDVPYGWQATTYGAVLKETHERRGDQTDLPVLSVTKTQGPMLASERFGKPLHGRDLAKYRVARRGTIVADPMLLWDGSIGRQEVVDAGLVSPDYRVYELVDHVSSDFMRYVVRDPSMLRHYQGGARGTNVRRNRIARGDFLRIPFRLPPLPAQRKIAAILSAADEVIAKAEAVIESLLLLKKAMMQELLTRGLPGRHTRFRQTEIGEMPDSWTLVRVQDVAPEDRPCAQTGPFGQQLRPAEFVDSGVPVLKIGNVRWGYMDLRGLDFVSEEKAIELARFAVREGDLLFARQGATTGRNALADARCAGSLINYHIIRVAVDPKRCDSRFLSICFNSELVQRQVGQNKQRGNRDGINTQQILGFRFPLPTLVEQERIAEGFDHITSLTKQHQAEVVALRDTKSALMTALLTGELRVTPDESPA